MTIEEIRQLKMYYDLPRLICEEIATIRHCEEQRDIISLPGVLSSGMPSGKGTTSDMTANMALSHGSATEYDREIAACSNRIAGYRELQNRIRSFLLTLDTTDLKIIRLKYLGPRDPRERERWRSPSWRKIARQLDYSEQHVRRRVKSVFYRFSQKDERK